MLRRRSFPLGMEKFSGITLNFQGLRHETVFFHFCSKDHVHTEQCLTQGIRLLVIRLILQDFWIAENRQDHQHGNTNEPFTDPCIVDAFDLISSLW